MTTPLDGGVTAELLAGVVGPDTALVALSHVNYRSAHVTEGGVHVEMFHSRGDDRRSFESIIAVVETEPHLNVHAADRPPSRRRDGR